MAWFRVDDTLPFHAKVIAAGNAAIGLWTRAGAWSMQQLTDGYIPKHVARTMGTAAEARRLVQCGLWMEEGDGFRFHQWDGRQPSREKVEAERHAAAERQRLARERAKSQRESQRDTGVSHGPPDPTRPDPTQKIEEASASSADFGSAAKLTADWIRDCQTPPPKKLAGQVRLQIQQLLDEGFDPAQIRRGVGNWAQRRTLGPALIPNIVHEVGNERPQQPSQDWRDSDEPPDEILSDPDAYGKWVRDRSRRSA